MYVQSATKCWNCSNKYHCFSISPSKMVTYFGRMILLLAAVVMYSTTKASIINSVTLHTSTSTSINRQLQSIDKLVGIKGGKIKPKAKSKNKSEKGYKVCFEYCIFLVVINLRIYLSILVMINRLIKRKKEWD